MERVLPKRKTSIMQDGRRVYHSYSMEQMFANVKQSDVALMVKSDIVLMAPGFYGRFKELMPALAKEEELAFSMGKTVMYQSIYNLSYDERMAGEALVDNMIKEIECANG